MRAPLDKAAEELAAKVQEMREEKWRQAKHNAISGCQMTLFIWFVMFAAGVLCGVVYNLCKLCK